MMLVKAHIGGGAWELHQVHSELAFLGPHSCIEIPDRGDHDFDGDGRFPNTVYRVVHLAGDPHGDIRFVRWVSWSNTDGARVQLVTDDAVFICNERGDTVEALR